jgi:hypothetical protein
LASWRCSPLETSSENQWFFWMGGMRSISLHVCTYAQQYTSCYLSHVNQHRICQTCDRAYYVSTFPVGTTTQTLILSVIWGWLPLREGNPPILGHFPPKKHEIIHIDAYFYPEKWAKLEVYLLCIYVHWLTTTWAYISDQYQGWRQYAPAHDSWADESDINTPNLLTEYKKRTVTKVLSQLNQSANLSLHQSAAQSSRPKRQQKIHIRTIETDNEETFPPFPPSSACLSLHDLAAVTPVSTASIGLTTLFNKPSIHRHISNTSISVPCVSSNLPIALLSDATSV